MSKLITFTKETLYDKNISFSIIRKILETKSFYAEYQPIVVTDTLQTFGYEALSRFVHDKSLLSAKDVFAFCHTDRELFFKLEMATKKLQMAKRPTDGTLFINFDPHIFYKREKINDVFALFQNKKNFVIELVENSHQGVNIELLVEIFRRLDHKFAIADFFQDNTELSIYLLNQCDYLKLDMGILKQLKTVKNFHYIVDGFISFAHSNNKKVILEGVETSTDLEIAHQHKIDFVQGLYFRENFLQSGHY